MQPDDNVYLCFRVSLRKLVNYMEREQPTVASQLSECLGAGTGCQWCVPYLRGLHAQFQAGRNPDLPVSPEEYATQRASYKRSGLRPAGMEEGAPSGDAPAAPPAPPAPPAPNAPPAV